jgi:DNA-binding PadR family transcriptional regulator
MDIQRFSDPALFILISLADGSKHGYAIMEDAEALSGVRMGPGTLYGALSRLEERGLIEPLPGEARRRPYRITSQGTAFLQEELERLSRLTAAGLLRLERAILP